MSRFKVGDEVMVANPPKDDGMGIPAGYWGKTGRVDLITFDDAQLYEVFFDPPPGVESYILVEEHNLEAAK